MLDKKRLGEEMTKHYVRNGPQEAKKPKRLQTWQIFLIAIVVLVAYSVAGALVLTSLLRFGAKC